jgi:hypothetical protein
MRLAIDVLKFWVPKGNCNILDGMKTSWSFPAEDWRFWFSGQIERDSVLDKIHRTLANVGLDAVRGFERRMFLILSVARRCSKSYSHGQAMSKVSWDTAHER